MFDDDPRAWEDARLQAEIVANMEAKHLREMEHILSDPVTAQALYVNIMLNKERTRIWDKILKYIKEEDYATVEKMIFKGE